MRCTAGDRSPRTVLMTATGRALLAAAHFGGRQRLAGLSTPLFPRPLGGLRRRCPFSFAAPGFPVVAAPAGGSGAAASLDPINSVLRADSRSAVESAWARCSVPQLKSRHVTDLGSLPSLTRGDLRETDRLNRGWRAVHLPTVRLLEERSVVRGEVGHRREGDRKVGAHAQPQVTTEPRPLSRLWVEELRCSCHVELGRLQLEELLGLQSVVNVCAQTYRSRSVRHQRSLVQNENKPTHGTVPHTYGGDNTSSLPTPSTPVSKESRTP